MKLALTTLMTIFITVTFAYGQKQNATTDDDKKVILNPDGTWEYAEVENIITTYLDPNDCANWIEITEDKVSGNSYPVMKEYLVVSKDGGKKGFGINLMSSKDGSIIFTIKAVGAGSCIDEEDKINILFTDGTRLELLNDGDFNCKNNATVYFGGIFGKKKELAELKTKKIDIMRVWTSDSFVEEQFGPVQAEQFINALNCLTK